MEAFAKKKGKEGTRGSNQIARENAATLVFYRNMILGVNGMYFVTMMLFGNSFYAFDITMFAVSLIVNSLSFQFMRSMGSPKMTDSGQVLDSGVDLNMEGGLAEHAKDAIILTSLSQALSLLTNWFWLLLLLAPLRGFLMLWSNVISPWIFQPAPEEDEVSEKKQKKLERRMKRSMR